MINLVKVLKVTSLAFLLAAVSVVPIRADQDIYIDDKGHIVEVINDDFSRIKEGDHEYLMKYDFDRNVITINDNHYDLEMYFELLSNSETSTITEVLESLSLYEISYSDLNDDGGISLAFTLPTTGYGREYSLGTKKKINMKFALSASIIGGITAFFFPGGKIAFTKAFVTKVIDRAISAGFASVGAQQVTGDGYYKYYQAQHPTVYGAVKERRTPFTRIQNLDIYGSDYTYFFWGSRPDY